MSANYPDIATFIHAIDAEKQRFKRSEENSFSPLKLLPKAQQVNAFTKKKFSEAMDDASEENIKQLLETTEAFIKNEKL